MSAPVHVEPKAPATSRILAAARALVARGGAADVSMGDVAAHAGVSKALVHYHFHDKDSLLLSVVEDVGQRVLRRAREAMQGEGDVHVLDAFWAALEHELQVGDLRILTALSEYDSERVRVAAKRVAAERREVAAEHIALVFQRLDLTLRVPAEIVADTVTAFADGLATAHALDPDRDPRPAFDVLWLALLTLVE